MELKLILEAVLFAAQKPLTSAELKDVLKEAAGAPDAAAARPWAKAKREDIQAALEQLAADHSSAGRSFRLVCVAEAWQFVSEPDFALWVRALSGQRARPGRLSQPALETLSIIAYRQPITRAEIEQIRGVSVDGVMQTLLERNLVEPLGRAEVAGRPLTYGTTRLFLEYFGLADLEALPAADELRRIPVERPPSLVTVGPGLATAPPQQLLLTPQAPSPGLEGSPAPGEPAALADPASEAAPPAESVALDPQPPEPAAPDTTTPFPAATDV